jgi:hypothetical protein
VPDQVRPSKAEVLEWERRWAAPTAAAALAAVVLVIGAIAIATQAVGNGSGEATLLQDVNRHQSAQMISSILQAIGVGLLVLPLYYLFRAARARSQTMRGQLVGVVVAAPLFLAVLAVLSGISTIHAASDFVSNSVPRLVGHGVSLTSERANNLASEAISEAPLRPLATGFGLGGEIGFVVAMFYTCLHAMRSGLLSRFWGSLGMALGAVSFIFFQFALLWFVYLGILLLRRDSQPPAWAAGEAIPWPSAGEKAASQLQGQNGRGGEPPELPEGEAGSEPPEEGGGPPRKRKQRT